MNYDERIEICRRIRLLEYDASGGAKLKHEIDSSKEFTRDEKEFLYFSMNRFMSRNGNAAGQDFGEKIGRYFPYILAFGAGYGTRVVQEKVGEYVEDGKEKARADFLNQHDSLKTSS